MEGTARTVWKVADGLRTFSFVEKTRSVWVGVCDIARRREHGEHLHRLNILQGTPKHQWRGKAENKAVGISRGGRTTKIHTLVDGLGNPLAFLLSPGNEHDSVHAVPLLGQISNADGNILGDKAYGAKAIREYIIAQGATYTILPRSDINDPWPVDWYTYKELHLVECFFQKLK